MESQTPNPILRGDSPLLISIPHSGTRLTSELLQSLNAIDRGRHKEELLSDFRKTARELAQV